MAFPTASLDITRSGMKCQLCDTEAPLIESHVIPRPFFVGTGASPNSGKILSSVVGIHPKRSPVGPYDGGILCASCDGRIGVWDEVGVRLLHRELHSFELHASDGAALALTKESYDYSKLKLFFLSVLWRSGVSSLPMFGRVSLGPHQARLRSMLLRNEPGRSSDYSVALGVYTERGQLAALGIGMMDPFRERFDGILTYRYYLGRVTALIKVDARPFLAPLSEVCMDPSRPLVLVARDLQSSPELKAVGKVISAPQNARAFRRSEDRSNSRDV